MIAHRAAMVLFFLLTWTVAIHCEAVAEIRRYALVVGINSYPSLKAGTESLDLENPVSDAEAISEALSKMGFAVQRLLSNKENAHRATIKVAWQTLLDKLKPGDTALFYFAGHGIELKGRNFLLPQDAVFSASDPHASQTLTKSALDFQDMLEELGRKQAVATGSMGVFIIDACRENPFGLNARLDESLQVGLSAVLPPKDVFVMYSAGLQQRALDGGPGTHHSAYAEQLLALLDSDKRELPLSLVAQTLRVKVYQYAQANGHLQIPAYYDQLTYSRSLTGEPRDPGQPQSNEKIPLAWRGMTSSEVIIDCTFCPEVVPLAPGTFQMGSPANELGHASSEEPIIPVRIASRIAFGRFEVTNREWDSCVRDGKCRGPARTNSTHSSLERLPVTDVSWDDAQAYVSYLSKFTGHKYRLPTEAEWEYAARAATQATYSFGDKREDLCTYANGADQHVGALLNTNQGCDDRVGREPAPVGTYKPNTFGLYDMHGNIWEWAQDCWLPDYRSFTKAADGFVDGAVSRQAPGGNCASRVARGGSWRSGPDALRSAARKTFPPSHRRITLGFRVVRELD